MFGLATERQAGNTQLWVAQGLNQTRLQNKKSRSRAYWPQNHQAHYSRSGTNGQWAQNTEIGKFLLIFFVHRALHFFVERLFKCLTIWDCNGPGVQKWLTCDRETSGLSFLSQMVLEPYNCSQSKLALEPSSPLAQVWPKCSIKCLNWPDRQKRLRASD